MLSSQLMCLFTSVISQIEQRIDEIQKWLGLDDATVASWKVWTFFFISLLTSLFPVANAIHPWGQETLNTNYEAWTMICNELCLLVVVQPFASWYSVMYFVLMKIHMPWVTRLRFLGCCKNFEITIALSFYFIPHNVVKILRIISYRLINL